MAYIFQCDRCGQNGPKVAEYGVLVAEWNYWKKATLEGHKNRFEFCEACSPLVEEELTRFLKKVNYGNA